MSTHSSASAILETSSTGNIPWRESLDQVRVTLNSRLSQLRDLEHEVRKKSFIVQTLAGPGFVPSDSLIIVGVCAMAKKATSKPMREILSRLPSEEFQVLIFNEKMVCEDPVATWPICDCLIAFYSDGYPLHRVEQYCKLRQPHLLNDVTSQRILWDRRRVYQTCMAHNIPVPRHVVVMRSRSGVRDEEIVEGDDWIEVNGERIDKPFVEKPVDADNHEVRIYYPRSSGGGCKELFRKVGDRSSEFYPNRDRIRRDDSYMYEEFMPTEGTDVKVYAVTSEYAHAEARKSPVMDGKVKRDGTGAEVRFPIILSNFEKEIARRICEAFKQRVCGFDMLRSRGKAFVCDVNGWSFVKRSPQYTKDAGALLAKCMRAMMGRPQKYEEEVVESPLERPWGGPLGQDHEELRAVIAVFRHGDRTPKQKLKFLVSDAAFLDLYKRHAGAAGAKDIKLKTAKELSDVLRVIDEATSTDLAHWSEDFLPVLFQARAVLEMHGTFRGINRKVQMRVTKEDAQQPGAAGVLEVQFILKWGGVLTHLGRQTAEQIGRSFRERLYPGTDGLLRLHSTYRHDLKIYSSDEGRVQVTAAAFAKGLLDLEGHLTPILISLVRKDGDVNQLLDDTSRGARQLEKAKQNVKLLLANTDKPSWAVPSSVATALSNLGDPVTAMSELHAHIKGLAGQLRQVVRRLRAQGRPERFSVAAAVARTTSFRRTGSDQQMESGMGPESEGGSAAASLGVQAVTGASSPPIDRGDGASTISDMVQLCFARWEKLQRDFYKPKTQTYDHSKIPDIYDCVKYDVMHNPELFRFEPPHLLHIFTLAKKLADIVVPQEYGCEPLEKLDFGASACRELLKKISDDLVAASTVEEDEDTGEGGTESSHSRRLSEMSQHSAESQGLKKLETPPILSPRGVMSPKGNGGKLFEGADEAVAMLPPIKVMSSSTVKEETQHRLDKRHARQVGIKSSDRHVRTRLYFTSESHMHAVLNVLRFAHLADESLPAPSYSSLAKLEETEELGYLSHLVFRLFEVMGENGQKRFSLRVAFSPGVPLTVPLNKEGRLSGPILVGSIPDPSNPALSRLANQLPPAAPFIPLWSDLDLDQALDLLTVIAPSQSPSRPASLLQRSFSQGPERSFSAAE
jgi:inositol hexakisphosphate/diphosphoinositol-pentakisphosphate kinase